MAVGATEYVDKTIADGVFIPDVWSKKVIKATEAKLVFGHAVWRDFESDAKIGKTVKIASIGELSARAKAENTAITYETIAETATTLTIATWVYAAFGIEDIVRLQSNIALREAYQQKVGYALAKKLDTDLAALVAGFSQTTGTLGTNLTDDDILAAIEYLNEADAPEEDRVMVLSPNEYVNLMRQDKFVSGDYVSFNPVMTAKVPRLYGMPVLQTTNIYKPAAGQSANAIFQKEAVAAVVQKAPDMHYFYDIDFFTHKIAAETVYGVGETRDLFGVYLKGKY